jgi:hypothetical protein
VTISKPEPAILSKPPQRIAGSGFEIENVNVSFYSTLLYRFKSLVKIFMIRFRFYSSPTIAIMMYMYFRFFT